VFFTISRALTVGRSADRAIKRIDIRSSLDNAVGYGCWHVARLLVARGARVDKAWHAAALGMLGRLAVLLGSDPPAEDVSQAFWHACTGGRRRAAEYLLSRGADLNWEPDYAHGTPLAAANGLSTRQENVISWLREIGARSSSSQRAAGTGIRPGHTGLSVTLAKQQHLRRTARLIQLQVTATLRSNPPYHCKTAP
jgi:uncharacterized protein